ncbi:Sec-independent protein translocase subunit TatB [Pigmentiphaga sp. H8]|uniref:Sec-independent protein translocase protein TatB n=1 Tax=unclassified Pigmentiphaga TaxID=2626614 RepID=UPI000F5A0328|nr:Sec-independent protein translocase protein TatB [Pigmentiphaga sp. H8]AZG10849.1 Sec-independent protein translocase subunit TatB [Pigmentiphaga sp. H8]
MFDVSFTELLTIGVVALIVIGPERLPKVARTIGHLLGRAQRYVNDVKSDIRREVELDELRNLRKEMEDAARSLETTVKTNVDELHKGLNEVQQTVEGAARDVKDAASGTPEPAAEAPALDAPAAEGTATAPVDAPSAGQAIEPAVAHEAPSEQDLAQGSLFPTDPLPPSANQPAAGQPAEASTVRERT